MDIMVGLTVTCGTYLCAKNCAPTLPYTEAIESHLVALQLGGRISRFRFDRLADFRFRSHFSYTLTSSSLMSG